MAEFPFYKTGVSTLAKNIVENYERSMVMALVMELEREIADEDFTFRLHNLVSVLETERTGQVQCTRR